MLNFINEPIHLLFFVHFIFFLLALFLFFLVFSFKHRTYLRLLLIFELLSFLLIILFCLISFQFGVIQGEVFSLYILGISSLETAVGLSLVIFLKRFF